MDSSLVRTCPGIGRPCDRTVPHNPHDTRTISDRGILMITPIVFPPCIGDSRSLCRSFHMHHVRYRYGGDCEGVWRVEPVFLFRFRTSLDGRHEGRRDMRSAKGGKTAGTGSGNPCMGFRRPVPAVCRMVSAVKTCEEGQTRPMPGSSGRVSSGISAGSGGWSP